MILSKVEADAVYLAMFALGAIGARLKTTVGAARIRERRSGKVVITMVGSFDEFVEMHSSRASFATAYGLTPPSSLKETNG